MKSKVFVYSFLIVLWWIIGAVLCGPIIKLSSMSYFLSAKFVATHPSYIYMLLITAPFLLSNTISAFIVGLISTGIFKIKNCCRIALLLSLIGATLFTILSSYEEKLVFIITKLIAMGLFVFAFGYIGAQLGNYFRTRRG